VSNVIDIAVGKVCNSPDFYPVTDDLDLIMYLIALSECLLFLYVACTYLSTCLCVIGLGCLCCLSFVHMSHLCCVILRSLF